MGSAVPPRAAGQSAANYTAASAPFRTILCDPPPQWAQRGRIESLPCRFAATSRPETAGFTRGGDAWTNLCGAAARPPSQDEQALGRPTRIFIFRAGWREAPGEVRLRRDGRRGWLGRRGGIDILAAVDVDDGQVGALLERLQERVEHVGVELLAAATVEL